MGVLLVLGSSWGCRVSHLSKSGTSTVFLQTLNHQSLELMALVHHLSARCSTDWWLAGWGRKQGPHQIDRIFYFQKIWDYSTALTFVWKKLVSGVCASKIFWRRLNHHHSHDLFISTLVSGRCGTADAASTQLRSRCQTLKVSAGNSEETALESTEVAAYLDRMASGGPSSKTPWFAHLKQFEEKKYIRTHEHNQMA